MLTYLSALARRRRASIRKRVEDGALTSRIELVVADAAITHVRARHSPGNCPQKLLPLRPRHLGGELRPPSALRDAEWTARIGGPRFLGGQHWYFFPIDLLLQPVALTVLARSIFF